MNREKKRNKNSNYNFTEKEKDILKKFVEEHPQLYDPANKEYRDTKLKTDLWNQLGVILSKSGDICKKKFKYMRDARVKQEKKGISRSNLDTSTGETDEMTKLDDIIYLDEEYLNEQKAEPSPYESSSDELIDSQSSSHDLIDDSLHDEVIPLSNHIPSKHPTVSDVDRDLTDFFIGMKATMRNLTPLRLAKLKYEISRLVGEADIENAKQLENGNYFQSNE